MIVIITCWTATIITVSTSTLPLLSSRIAMSTTGLSPAGGCGNEVALCAGEVAVQAVTQCQRQDQPQRPHWQKHFSAAGNSATATSSFPSSVTCSYWWSPLCCQAVLKASITIQEPCTALAVVFLVDRFLYWADESSRLLRITKLLHRHHPGTPVAPQLVIRQARVYLNSGMMWWIITL